MRAAPASADRVGHLQNEIATADEEEEETEEERRKPRLRLTFAAGRQTQMRRTVVDDRGENG